MNYSVGDAAEELNLHTSTIRYYHQEGLLTFNELKESSIGIFANLNPSVFLF